MPPVAVGSVAPDFSATDSNGRPFRLSSLRGRPVVVYFYPKDNTPACTAQACAFRDIYQDFQAVGAEVVAVSSDSDDTHRGFADKHRLPFVMLSDGSGEIRRLFGVPRSLFGLVPGRVTYVIDPAGVVRSIFNSQLNVSGHIASAVEAIKAMGAGAPK